MGFNLTEEHRMVQERARDLAMLDLSLRANEVDSLGIFPWDALRQVADAEFMGMLLPEQYGGSGADLLSFVLAAQEMAKGCANTTLIFVTHVAASQGILLGGKEEIKETVLPSLARGEKLAAWAATEANAGSNLLAIETTAQMQGDNYLVNGSKIFITSAEQAEYYVIIVRTDQALAPQSLSALLIEKEIPGFSSGKRFLRMGMNGTSSGELYFDRCQVSRDHLLGQEGGYLPLGFAMAGVGMMGVAGMALGMAEAALEMCLKYGKQRSLAGQPLGSYQGIQFMVAEMSVEVEAARALVYEAASALAQAPPGPPIPAFQAKLFATETALRVIDKALQMHGGTGYCKDLPLERYYRDARGLTLHFSPSEPLKASLGMALMGLLP